MTSSNPCLDGPGFWCGSVNNAKQCKFVSNYNWRLAFRRNLRTPVMEIFKCLKMFGNAFRNVWNWYR